MHTIEIPSAKIYKEFPSELQELSPKQFLFFTKQFLELLGKKISLHDFKVLLASKFLQFKKTLKFYTCHESVQEEIYDSITRLTETMDSFLEYRDDNSVTINVSFTKNILPKIGKYYGPGDVLQNCTGFEYKEAHSAFKQFDKTQEVEHLDRLIAILYRPRKRWLFLLRLKKEFNGQTRTEFKTKSNPRFLEKRQKHFAKLPFHVKYAVFLIFQAFEEFICTGEIEIDGNEISLSELYKNDGDSVDPGIGIMSLFFELAESNVFGNLNKVMDTNIYDIFTRIYQLVKTSDHLKNKTENAENK